MRFMLSREVVLGPRGKKYFGDKVKDYKAICPTHLFNQAYGWYDEGDLLEEERWTIEQVEEQINSKGIEAEEDEEEEEEG